MKKRLIVSLVLLLCVVSAVVYSVTSSPRYALREYIIALKKKDYMKAYSMLSPDTQKRFSFEDVVWMNERAMTEMNEGCTFVYWQGVVIGMQVYEDPGWWGYLLVKHKGKWKVVMRRGIPSFPYVCDCCCR